MHLPEPAKPEIDHRTIKLIVGVIALSLGALTSAFAKDRIDSISASYYEGGTSQAILIGFLFAIAALLLAYNGQSRREMVLAKIAALAALGVALFPCVCEVHKVDFPAVHATSAAVMFVILAEFCRIFHGRARGKGHREALRRAWIYAACGWAIVASIAAVLAYKLGGDALRAAVPRLVFHAECTALVAFGISWLTASRTLPGITAPAERFRPLDDFVPPG